ncbi:uncharacterized protein LOC116338265 [Contarinia nasturtii]|uniref:uncharacterized protein LOC116338265 n=1 Tax=Contarinia nasturtii TaxID=265458 RepID=UPI0012D46980|nr:uncharacterized protein LOC116338265 [Contarinia nasturtii]
MCSELENGLPCCGLCALLIGSLPLLLLALSKRRYLLNDCINYSGRYIYPDKHEDEKYIEICSKHLDNMVKNVLFRISLVFLSFAFIELSLIYKYITDGTKSTMTQLRIPFTEENSNAEYIGNTLIQTSIGFHGFPGFIIMEIALEAFLGCIMIAPKLIEHEFEKMNDIIEKQKYNKLQVIGAFKYTMSLSMDAEEFSATAIDLLYWRTFFTPPAFTFSIAMSIFCQYMFDYVGGYGLTIIAFVQLYFLCAYGEIFQDNDTGKILYDTKWYALPVEVQKNLIPLIHQKQNSRGLSIGPFIKINIECFGIISKKIYSFIMFLLNFYQ